MASKTISLSLEAYARLRSAKRTPRESFTDVVLRAEWRERAVTAAELLRAWRSEGPHFPPAGLDLIESLQADDAPPEDKWRTP